MVILLGIDLLPQRCRVATVLAHSRTHTEVPLDTAVIVAALRNRSIMWYQRETGEVHTLVCECQVLLWIYCIMGVSGEAESLI